MIMNKKKLLSYGIITCSILLMLICVINNVWKCQEFNVEIGTEHFNDMYMLQRFGCFFAIWICYFSIVYILMKKIKTELIIKYSVFIYVAAILCGIMTILCGVSKEWLRCFSVNVSSPAILYLSVFLIAYMLCKYKTYSIHYLSMVILLFTSVPAVLLVFGFRCFAELLVLFLSLIILSIKAASDKRVSKKWFYILAFGVLIEIITLVVLIVTNSNRLNLTDSVGSGWMFNNLMQALQKTSFVGQSTFNVAIADKLSVPAYLYFANSEMGYWFATPILKFGWISIIPYIILMISLVYLLFKLASFATDNFSKYFTYSVAILYSVRTCINIFSCFSFFLHGVYLPFVGEFFSVIVDAVLCATAIALCNKKQSIKSDIIDKDCPTEGILSATLETIENKCKTI